MTKMSLGALRDDKKIGTNEADIPYSHQVQLLNGWQIPQRRWVFQVRPGLKKVKLKFIKLVTESAKIRLQIAYNTPVNLSVYISPEHEDPILLPLHPPQNIHLHYMNFHLPYQKRMENKAKEHKLHKTAVQISDMYESSSMFDRLSEFLDDTKV